MAQSCAEYVTKKDAKTIRQNFRTQEQRILGNSRRFQHLQIEGLQYSVTSDPIEIDKAIALQNKITARWEALSKAKSKELESQEREGQPLQTDIGEHIATQLGISQFDLQTVGYREPRTGEQGFDNVLMDKNGHYWIIEAKFTQRTGPRSLDTNKDGTKQASRASVEKTLEYMQNPDDKRYYRLENIELARKMQQSGADNIRRILFHTHPQTLHTIVYEGQPDGSWKPIRLFLSHHGSDPKKLRGGR